MVLLPTNLDFDPGFSALMAQPPISKKRLAEGVRLCARFFAPVNNTPSIQVPMDWEFFYCIFAQSSKI
jgi:hypothetical protein